MKASLFHRDVHRLKLELSAEHAAAHDPIVDLEYLQLLRVRTKYHGADKSVVAVFVQEPELQSYRLLCGGEMSYLFRSVSLGRRVELIGFVEQLRDAREIGWGKLPEYD